MRVDYRMALPEGVRAMAELEWSVCSARLEPELLELVWVPALQLNGWMYCLAMHSRNAEVHGEHQAHVDTVAAWREAPYHTALGRARAGLVRGANRAVPDRCPGGDPRRS